ncbi:MAG TPA: hypothetical protein VHR45_03315 [Thermoanaerobaculia bacterium]|nr:hypothetical protein [Thermoanaerobaculia bacterium]
MSCPIVRRTAAALVVASLLLPFSEALASQGRSKQGSTTAATRHSNPIWDFLVRLWTDASAQIDGNG